MDSLEFEEDIQSIANHFSQNDYLTWNSKEAICGNLEKYKLKIFRTFLKEELNCSSSSHQNL